jgi:NDP-sugar pyrophosphorylase family protein
MTKGIILSGGWGTRLRPLTCTMPKTLIPIVNKPSMERQMLLLKSAGVNEIILAVSVMSDIIKDYFKNGERLGLKIRYTDEEIPAGTAGAIKLAEDDLKDDKFFMLNGDIILNFNFSKMIHFHKNNNSFGTIASKVVEDPARYGVLISDSNNKVMEFLEKEAYHVPDGGPVPMPINAGVYLLEPEIFSYIPSKKKLSMERDIFPTILKERNLFHYPIEGIWKDIGKPYEFLLGNFLLMEDILYNIEKKQENLIELSSKIYSPTKIIPPCAIGDGVVIRENCVIGPNVIIGDNTHIEDNVKISNSVLFNGCHISKNVQMDHTIISEKCTIGSNAILKAVDEKLIILASHVKVIKGIELINNKLEVLSICHHEVVEESIKQIG